MNKEQNDPQYTRPYDFDGSSFNWSNRSYVDGSIEVVGNIYTNNN